MIVFIKENSPETRNKLKDAGFSICKCAKFKDSVWLYYNPNVLYNIHGEGYCNPGDWDEKYSPLERIQLRLKEEDYYSEEREFYDIVDEFLLKYGTKI